VTPHLPRNRTCLAHSYALLSESGAALLIDWGYDLTAGTPAVSERAARRPLLASLDALRREYGVDRIEVVVPTHFHDDHVAGIRLLRDVEGVEVWAPESVAPVLEEPLRFDLPCLWFDPVRVDRRLPHGEAFAWHEYEITPYHLPGHTLYAAALAFEVDGRRVVATGDQYAREGDKTILNYQYRNRFRIDDFRRSAELYARIRPDLMISGHWLPRAVTDDYLAALLDAGSELAELHRELLPLDAADFGAEGFGARIEPYRSELRVGEVVALRVFVRNPFARDAEACVRLALPAGWTGEPAEAIAPLAALGEGHVDFEVRPTAAPVRRARLAADLTVDGARFGQQAEALVTVS
jgi:glyoxylase-like metal-dependent hydrolase (beta-lactamase superfamily II)